jgi:hypothetical protein
MQLKKEYLILLLVIAALGAYLMMRSKDQTHFELPRLSEVESNKINRFVISKDDSTIELNKKDDQWTIGPKAYKADGIKVKNMLKAAVDLSITALVSESENYERYDLADEKKVNVQAFADKEILRNFAIGRQAPTSQHTFVRLADDPRVYHARGNIHFTFDNTVDDLRDETVLAYEKSDIKGLTIAKGKQSLTLTRKEVLQEKETPSGEKKEEQKPQTKSQWMDSNGTVAREAIVESLINDLSRLKCNDYLEDSARDSLNNPTWTVTLNSENGDHTLSVFNKESEESIEFPAISSGTPYAFILNKSRVEKFEKDINQLLSPEEKQ